MNLQYKDGKVSYEEEIDEETKGRIKRIVKPFAAEIIDKSRENGLTVKDFQYLVQFLETHYKKVKEEKECKVLNELL